MRVEEYHRPQAMAAGTSYKIGGIHMAGFLCTVGGTVNITDADGTVLVSALVLVAGGYTPIPLLFNTSQGGTIALTTAAGTVFI